jgi:hypothetical protein
MGSPISSPYSHSPPPPDVLLKTSVVEPLIKFIVKSINKSVAAKDLGVASDQLIKIFA